ncbi:MAG: flagellar hook-associated protein FlgL [Planctomycetes bacterium]|nr:flagellar hook-associated protein FlgL [Planctomycetota bacterium]MCB9884564.1 flagellar hook-associated protein FlgL [Planctomycetota bacterium]
MSLRITQGMLYSRALGDVQSGLYRYSQLQQQISTGRRINRPSDDPAGSLRILPIRNDLRNLDQLTNNVALARETLNTGAGSLEDASAAMQRVRELTTQASNGTLSTSDRRSIGAEMEQLLNQMVGIGNSRRGDRYLFGGTENGTPPFELVTVNGHTRAVYHGNRESLEVEVAPGVTTALNVPGDRIFLQRDRGATLFSATPGGPATGAVPTGRGDTGVGFGELEVSFAGLHTDAPSTVTAGAGNTNALGQLSFTFTSAPDTLSIGGGPALNLPITDGNFTTADGRTISLTVTGVPATTTGTFTAKASLSIDGGETVTEVSDFSSSSISVRDSFDGSVLNVDVRTLARTGTEDVKYTGTFDALTTLITMRDLLRNEEGLPDDVVRDRIAQMMTEIDSAHDAVLDGVRELGFRSSSMDVLGNRVEGLRIARTESLSMVQDTDIAEAILELQKQDLSYQAALQVSARVVQTSLQGFLR